MPRMKGILPNHYGCSWRAGGPELPAQSAWLDTSIQLFVLLRYTVTCRRLAILVFRTRPEKVNEMAETCHLNMYKWKEQLQAKFLYRSLSARLTPTRNLDLVLSRSKRPL